jgi:malyl-CoA/(S)-citramalyl-CoA lyase
MAAKIPEIAKKCDVMLGNLEDAIQADNKDRGARRTREDRAPRSTSARASSGPGSTASTRPWCLDDLTTLVTEIGDKLDVIMVPKVEGAEDIHYVDRLLAQLEARAGLQKPLMVHAILETALGVVNVEEICSASPRMQGLSLGPADLAADRRMKTTRVGGGHPGYLVREDPNPANETRRARSSSRTCGTTPSPAWSTPAPRTASSPTTARSATSRTWSPARTSSATPSCWVASAPGASTLSRSTSPRRSFSPSTEVLCTATKVIAAMGDGTGAVMIDGKMEDDASSSSALIELAERLAKTDPELASLYAAAPDPAAATSAG